MTVATMRPAANRSSTADIGLVKRIIGEPPIARERRSCCSASGAHETFVLECTLHRPCSLIPATAWRCRSDNCEPIERLLALSRGDRRKQRKANERAPHHRSVTDTPRVPPMPVGALQ